MHFFRAIIITTALVTSIPADLIISEINDGPIGIWDDRWIEVTNTGPNIIPDGSIYDIATANNGSTTVINRSQLPARPLAVGEAIVFAASAEWVENTYGISGVIHASMPGVGTGFSGDDVLLIVNTGADASNPDDIIDIFGILGVNGTNKTWEYEDSRAYRRAGVTAASASTFSEFEWIINDPNDTDGLSADDMARIANPGTHNLHLLTLATQQGGGTLDGTVPGLAQHLSSTDLVDGVAPTISGLGLHPSATGGAAVFTDGLTNATNPNDGLLADANGSAQPISMSWSFESDPVFITGINVFTQSDAADARIFLNCHVHLDLTDDSTDNPTPYAEFVIGGPEAVNSTDTWGAAYVGVNTGTLGGDPAEVFNIRLDFFSVTDDGNAYRGEGMGSGGSIIKEIDIMGQTNPVELSVFGVE